VWPRAARRAPKSLATMLFPFSGIGRISTKGYGLRKNESKIIAIVSNISHVYSAQRSNTFAINSEGCP
jgi:hypothetical protein